MTEIPHVGLEVGARYAADVSLKGRLLETVEVRAEAPLLQTGRTQCHKL